MFSAPSRGFRIRARYRRADECSLSRALMGPSDPLGKIKWQRGCYLSLETTAPLSEARRVRAAQRGAAIAILRFQLPSEARGALICACGPPNNEQAQNRPVQHRPRTIAQGKICRQIKRCEKTGFFFRTMLWAVSKDTRAAQRKPPSALDLHLDQTIRPGHRHELADFGRARNIREPHGARVDSLLFQHWIGDRQRRSGVPVAAFTPGPGAGGSPGLWSWQREVSASTSNAPN